MPAARVLPINSTVVRLDNAKRTELKLRCLTDKVLNTMYRELSDMTFDRAELLFRAVKQEQVRRGLRPSAD